MSEPASPGFDVVLRPHRSLSPAGFWIVMGILVVWSFVGGIVFLSVGAWPVIGFFGIDVVLVYWAFRASYGDRRGHEGLLLCRGTLTPPRGGKRGAQGRVYVPPF